jgi:hypothetical protein
MWWIGREAASSMAATLERLFRAVEPSATQRSVLFKQNASGDSIPQGIVQKAANSTRLQAGGRRRYYVLRLSHYEAQFLWHGNRRAPLPQIRHETGTSRLVSSVIGRLRVCDAAQADGSMFVTQQMVENTRHPADSRDAESPGFRRASSRGKQGQPALQRASSAAVGGSAPAR